jgi:L-lactate dehydrogenase (cytochrome)
MMDSRQREGPDIANTLACGAEFTFLGRSFMYGISAMGKEGGNYTMAILKI